MKKRLWTVIWLSVLAAILLTVTVVPALALDPANSGNVAKIEGKGEYATLQGAVDAAEDNDVIEIIADHEVNYMSDSELVPCGSYHSVIAVMEKSVIIDLNGHDITWNLSYEQAGYIFGIFTDNNGHLILRDSGVAKGDRGSISMTTKKPVYALFVNMEAGCSLTIEEGRYTLDS